MAAPQVVCQGFRRARSVAADCRNFNLKKNGADLGSVLLFIYPYGRQADTTGTRGDLRRFPAVFFPLPTLHHRVAALREGGLWGNSCLARQIGPAQGATPDTGPLLHATKRPTDPPDGGKADSHPRLFHTLPPLDCTTRQKAANKRPFPPPRPFSRHGAGAAGLLTGGFRPGYSIPPLTRRPRADPAIGVVWRALGRDRLEL